MTKAPLLSLLLLLLAAPRAAALTITLPPETARLKQIPGVEAATPYCYTCHSVDYITTQAPNMPRSFWAAEVDKMRHTYGAPVPDDQVAAIVDYLVKAYGDGNSKR